MSDTGKWDSEYKAAKSETIKPKQPQWTEEELKRYHVRFPDRVTNYSSFREGNCVFAVHGGTRSVSFRQCTRKALPGLEICGVHKKAIDKRIEADNRRQQERTRQALQRAADNAKSGDLNARIEGITGEPSHVRVNGVVVNGLDVESLEAVLRAAEDAILGISRK